MGKHTRYAREFKRKVVLMMKTAPSIPKLARELGLYKNQLYKWRRELDGLQEEMSSWPAESPPRREPGLEAKNSRLKKMLAEKVLEADFFKSALRRVEAVGRSRNSGGPAFMPKSGPERSGKAD
jgi:transposase-like protein